MSDLLLSFVCALGVLCILMLIRNHLVAKVMHQRTDFVYQHRIAIINAGKAPQGYKYDYPDVDKLYDRFMLDLTKWKYEQFFPD